MADTGVTFSYAGGVVNSQQPVAVTPSYWAGGMNDSFLGEIENKILIFPTRFWDLGSISGAVQVSFYLWNTYRDKVTAQQIQFNNLDGSEITSGTFPTILGSWSSTLFVSINVTTEGSGFIDGQIIIVLDSQPNEIIHVTGTRMTLFNAVPQVGMREVVEWLTDVLEGYNGDEQRIRLRRHPRTTWEFTTKTTSAAAARKLQNFLYGTMMRPTAMPLWYETTKLTNPPQQGDLTITLNTANANYQNGGLVFIYQDDGLSELIQVQTVTANSLVLDSAIANVYEYEVLVMPAVSTLLKSATMRDMISDTYVAEADLVMDMQYPWFPDGPASSTQYENMDVLTDQQILDGEYRERQLSRYYTTIDASTGRVEYDLRNSYVQGEYDLFLWCKDKAALWNARRFLARRCGQIRPFWIPTQYNDFYLTEAVEWGSIYLSVADAGYTKGVGSGMQTMNRIQIKTRTGQTFYRKIVASSITLLGEQLTLDAPINASITLAQIASISFLRLMRVASDRIEIVHSPNGREGSNMAIPLREVIQ